MSAAGCAVASLVLLGPSDPALSNELIFGIIAGHKNALYELSISSECFPIHMLFRQGKSSKAQEFYTVRGVVLDAQAHSKNAIFKKLILLHHAQLSPKVKKCSFGSAILTFKMSQHCHQMPVYVVFKFYNL